jgi:CBS domain-containing protein
MARKEVPVSTPRTARDVMSQPVLTLSRYANVVEAARFLLDNRLSGVPVVDDAGKGIGMFTFRDMAKYFLDPTLLPGGGARKADPGKERVSDLMSPHIESVRPEATLEDCRRAMRQHKTHRVLVQDAQGKIVGIVSASDLGLRSND